MELHLKQWRDQQHESEEHQVPAEKIPKLFLEQPHHHHHHEPPPPPPLHHHHHLQLQQQQHPTTDSSSSALPLFVPEPTSKISCLSAPFSDSTTSRNPRMGSSYFSLAQWQELELQALIYRYMLAGASVPPELLHPIKKSLLNNSSPYFLHHHSLQQYPHYQPALLQSGYWGRGAMDPEPGRCRRTDGKKWRCSRDVVVGHKYCERHMHRGRNRSRTHVEIPTPTPTTTTTSATTGTFITVKPTTSSSTIVSPSSLVPQMANNNGTNFAFSAPSNSSIDLFQFNQR